MTDRILSLDVGVHLGYVQWDRGDIRCGVLILPDDRWDSYTHARLEDLIGWADCVIVENYTMRTKAAKRMRNQPIHTAEILGYAVRTAERLNVPVIRSNPANKWGWPDDTLKTLGLYKLTRIRHGQHARDALRHLLWYLATVDDPWLNKLAERSIHERRISTSGGRERRIS